MQKPLKGILRFAVQIFIIVFFVLVSFLVYISVNDYKPQDMKRLPLYGSKEDVLPQDMEFSFVSWNIGYGGLGSDMDFFYDGGEMVRPAHDQYENYFSGIMQQLENYTENDFILLQEVDVRSKRSYFVNQKQEISGIFKDHFEVFARNYDVSVVPVPLLDPLGKVEAGLMTFSAYKPSEALRIAFPNLASWPKKLFLLDRAMIALHIPLPDTENELVVINTHLSYYINEGNLRQKELDILKDYSLKEYEKGNYVIAGGDWNQNPPDLKSADLVTGDIFEPTHISLGNVFMPTDWQWAYDKNVPTNRSTEVPYNRGETPATIIDFFLVSPNVEVLEVKALDMGFAYSDHQPVVLKVQL